MSDDTDAMGHVDFDAAKDRLAKEAEPILAEIAPGVPERLNQLREDLENTTISTPPIESILALVDPMSLGERAEHHYGEFARQLEGLRNFLALLPLILTWASLGLAIREFGLFANRTGTSASDRSFLDLWQSGFDGTAPFYIPRFHHVALIDVTLLSGLIVVSYWQHRRAQFAAGRGRTLRRYLELESHDLMRKIEDHHARRTQEAMRESMVTAITDSSSALGKLAQDLKEVTSETTEQRESLRLVTDSLHTSIGEMSDHTKYMRELATVIHGSIDEIGKNAAQLERLRPEIQTALASVAGEVASQVKRLSDAVTELRDKFDRYDTLASAVNGLEVYLRDEGQNIAARDGERLAELRKLQVELTKQLETTYGTLNQRLADIPSEDAIAGAITSLWEQTARQNLENLNTQLAESFNGLARHLSEHQIQSQGGFNEGLTNLLSQLNASFTGLETGVVQRIADVPLFRDGEKLLKANADAMNQLQGSLTLVEVHAKHLSAALQGLMHLVDVQVGGDGHVSGADESRDQGD